MNINSLVSTINKNLKSLDRILNGLQQDMPFFDFRNHFLDLIAMISEEKNLTRENIYTIGEYYSMLPILEVEYEKWDMENYETLSEKTYGKINSMYASIYNTANTELLRFLEIYDSENIVTLDFDRKEEKATIQLYLQSLDDITSGKYQKIKDSIALKPGIFGISVDLKKLFGKKYNK